LLYVIGNEINGYGDLETIRKSENRDFMRLVEAIKVGEAIFTAYRLWNNKEFQQSKTKIRLYFTPQRDGIAAGVTYRW